MIISVIAGLIALLIGARWFRNRVPRAWKVEVFKYTRIGTRDMIFSSVWFGYSDARAAGQAVMFYLDGIDPDHAYTFEVKEQK